MALAIYHRVMRREGFEETAKILIELLKDAQSEHPDEPRDLFLDIDGHRNEQGGFDAEMLELQQDFILGFLGRYFTSIHLPLLSVTNPNGQENDVPLGLSIINADQAEEDELAALYIENYSNTEFASEEPVHEFLAHLSALLVDLHSIHPRYRSNDDEGRPEWRAHWHSYLLDLMTELFNGFVLGNLITVSAMTRTLIEAYAYISIFDQNVESDLVSRWYACNALAIAKKMQGSQEARARALIRDYCESVGLNCEELEKQQKKHGDHAWLCPLIGEKRISFRAICDHLGESAVYEDFQWACAYIHGQDVTTKLSPFAFYSTIFGKLYAMSDYIFRVVNLLFPDEDEITERVEELYVELFALGEEYVLSQQPADS